MGDVVNMRDFERAARSIEQFKRSVEPEAVQIARVLHAASTSSNAWDTTPSEYCAPDHDCA